MAIRSTTVEGLDEACRQSYQLDGCLLLKAVYPEADVQRALRSVHAALPEDGYASDIWMYSNIIGSLCSEFSRTQSEWDLYQSPKLFEAIRFLVDWEQLRWHKVTGTLSVCWPNQEDGVWPHLDYAGEPLDQGEALVYGMIYLTDVDETGARTKVCPGSHHTVRAFLNDHPDDPRIESLHSEVEFLEAGDAVPVDVEAGDVLLFDYLLVHSGGGQQNSEARPVLRVGFSNALGDLAGKRANVPASIDLSPVGRDLTAPL